MLTITQMVDLAGLLAATELAEAVRLREQPWPCRRRGELSALKREAGLVELSLAHYVQPLRQERSGLLVCFTRPISEIVRSRVLEPGSKRI